MGAQHAQVVMARPRFPIRQVLGGLLILAGLLYLLFGWPGGPRHSEIRYEHLGESRPDAPWLASLGARYRVEGSTRYQIIHDEGSPVLLDAVRYQDEQGQRRSAIFFSPETDSAGVADNPLRLELWRETGAAINKHAAADSIFVTWWDNAQRVHLMTGRATWLELPAASAFQSRDQRNFWERAAGGFTRDEGKIKQLATWLAMDADQALSEMAMQLPRDRPIYFLMSLDDLARLSEIEALAGVTLPFEVRIFPQSNDIHRQIAAVRDWAGAKGPGAYLVQQLPQGGVRAWRITTEAGAKSLLARLLPFTTSLVKPLDHQSLIYQSRWGGYLSVYQWQP